MSSHRRFPPDSPRARGRLLDRFSSDELTWMGLFLLGFLWVFASGVETALTRWHEEQLLMQCRETAIASHYSASDVASLCKLPAGGDGLDLEFSSISTPDKPAPSASAAKSKPAAKP